MICKHTDFTKIFLPSNDIVFLTRVILSEGTEQLPKANLHPFEVISKPLPFMKSLLHYCLEEAGSLVCICTSSIQENFPSGSKRVPREHVVGGCVGQGSLVDNRAPGLTD